MTEPFLPLADLASLHAAVERSRNEPVLIFKHSAACGVSAQAYDDVREWYAGGGVAVPIFLLHVRQQRAISNAVADRFGIRHESPQVLLLDRGEVRWHGSHWHVNGREVQRALDGVSR